MNDDFSPELIERHDVLYQQAVDLCEPYLLINGQPQKALGFFGKGKLKKAIDHLSEVVKINPGNWQAYWIIGKINQRLGDFRQALRAFDRAAKLCITNADISREAVLVALEAGEYRRALDHSQKAMELKPDDPGIMANHAIVLIFLNELGEAMEVIVKSLQINPNDAITMALRKGIARITNGKVRPPGNIRELENIVHMK